MAIDDLYKFGIDAIREINMIFEFRTELFDIKVFQVIHVYDCMWVSHRDSSDTVSLTIHIQRFIDYLFFGRDNRNLSGSQDRCAHIDFYKSNLAILAEGQIQIFDSALCGNGNACLIDNAVVVGIFCNTANAVSAHGALRTVQIVHIHFAVCDIRWFDQDQSV